VKTSWRLNLIGALIYVILVGWLLLASTLRILLNLETGGSSVGAFIGLALGALGLIGIGFGQIWGPCR
jgi:hypothetical protein